MAIMRSGLKVKSNAWLYINLSSVFIVVMQSNKGVGENGVEMVGDGEKVTCCGSTLPLDSDEKRYSGKKFNL